MKLMAMVLLACQGGNAIEGTWTKAYDCGRFFGFQSWSGSSTGTCVGVGCEDMLSLSGWRVVFSIGGWKVGRRAVITGVSR